MKVTTVRFLGKRTLVLDGLARMLTAHGFVVVSQVEHIALASDRLGETDLLLLTDGDRGIEDLAAVTMLRQRFPTLKLVMLSDVFDANAIVAAFEAGVSGYLTKDLAQDPLIGSLKLIAMGEKILPSRLVESLPSKTMTANDGISLKDMPLSNRERDIMELLTVGLSNKMISCTLGISESTVKVHVKSILRKLGVKNRTQAAMQALGSTFNQQDFKMRLLVAMNAFGLTFAGLPFPA